MKFLITFVVAALAASQASAIVLTDTLGLNEQFVPQHATWWASDTGDGEQYYIVFQPITNTLATPVRLTEWIEWRGVANYELSYPLVEHRIAIASSFEAALNSPRFGDLYNGVTQYTAWQSPDKLDIADNPINRVTHELASNDIVIPAFTTVWGSIFTYREVGVQATGKLETSMFVENSQHVQFFQGGYMFLVDSFNRQYSASTLDRISAEAVPEPATVIVFATGLIALVRKRSSSKCCGRV